MAKKNTVLVRAFSGEGMDQLVITCPGCGRKDITRELREIKSRVIKCSHCGQVSQAPIFYPDRAIAGEDLVS